MNHTVSTGDSTAATVTTDPRRKKLPQLLQHHRIKVTLPLTDYWKIDNMIHNLPANIYQVCINKELQEKTHNLVKKQNTWKGAES